MSIWGITELFVGNLPPETTDEEINTLFKGYGGVVEGWVAKKGKKAAAAGPAAASFGVVRMASHAEAQVAKKSLNGTTYKGKFLTVRWAENQRALWVGNLAPHVTNEILDSAFSQFGAVVSAVVVADSVKNASARYGFVVFDDKKDAQRALSQCREQLFLVGGSMVPVRVALARAEDAEAGYAQDGHGASKRARHGAESGTSHFAVPGGHEFSVAMRMRQLQLEYEAAKNKLKAQRAEMEAAALMGGDVMALSAALAPPQLGGGNLGMGPQGMQQGGRPMQGLPMQGMGSGPGVGGGGGMMQQMAPPMQMPPPLQMPPMPMGPKESYHHVPPPRQIKSEKTYERFNPRPHPPSDHAAPPGSTPISYPPPAAAAPPPQPAAAGGLKFVSAGSLSTVKDAAAAAAAGAAAAAAGAAPTQPAPQDAAHQGPAGAPTTPTGTAAEGSGQDLVGVVPGAKAPGSHDHKGLGFSGPDPTPAAPPTHPAAPAAAPPPDMRQPYLPPTSSYGSGSLLPKYESQLPQRFGDGPRLGWNSGGPSGGLPGVVLQQPSYNGQAASGPTSMPVPGFGGSNLQAQGSYPPPMMPPSGPPGGAYQPPPPLQPPSLGNIPPPNGMGAPPPGPLYGPPPGGMGGPPPGMPPMGGELQGPPGQMLGGGGYPPMGPPSGQGPPGWAQGPPGGVMGGPGGLGGPGGPMHGGMPQGPPPPMGQPYY